MSIDNTKLTRPEYTAKTNQWIEGNPKEWKKIRSSYKHPFSKLQQIMEGLYGKPIWRDRSGRNKITGTLPTKEDPGIGFTIKGQKGGNTVQYMSIPTRAATRGQPTGNSSGTRAYLEHAASSPDTDFVDADRAMAEARATGPNMDGGHITPLDRKVRGQEFKVQNGRGTVQEMNGNYDKAGIPYGHTRANIEPQTAQANRIDQRFDYGELDNHLKNLDNGTNGFKKSSLILNQYRAKSIGKALQVPALGGLIAGGAELLSGGTAASAATAFVDAENPIDGGALADGTLAANQNPQRDTSKPLNTVLFDFFRSSFDQVRQGARQSFNGDHTGRY